MFKAIRQSPALGATIQGIDLNRTLSDEEFDALRQALAEHQVLFFTDQHISHTRHQALGLRFGPLMRHPHYPTVEGFPDIIVLENDGNNPPKIDEWHIDMSFTDLPPLASILVGRIVPKNAGDTVFASLTAAYDDLPDSMKNELEGLTATHSLAHGFRDTLAIPGGAERMKKALRDNPPVTHPMVRKHPVTGRKLIFYSRTFTSKINELSHEESESLLSRLHRHIIQEQYLCQFRWGKNSIAFWDNRSVIHKPVNDYWPALRRMERVTIASTSAQR